VRWPGGALAYRLRSRASWVNELLQILSRSLDGRRPEVMVKAPPGRRTPRSRAMICAKDDHDCYASRGNGSSEESVLSPKPADIRSPDETPPKPKHHPTRYSTIATGHCPHFLLSELRIVHAQDKRRQIEELSTVLRTGQSHLCRPSERERQARLVRVLSCRVGSQQEGQPALCRQIISSDACWSSSGKPLSVGTKECSLTK
jgi:hypothetical protein